MSQAYIRGDDDGIRLDRWFKRHRPEVPHALLSRWTRQGKVTLNGAKADIGDRVVKGQLLVAPDVDPDVEGAPVRAARAPVSAEDAAYAQAMVIHRDPHALVLNKAPGLATQGGTRTVRHVDGLLDALTFEREERPKLVHRLDKDTSGVLLLARTPRAAAFFAKAFADRATRKVYWALVAGVPKLDHGLIVAALAKQPGTGGEKMTVDEKTGQAARTRYRVIERAGNKAAWLELQPLTGRTHQLRVHCAEVLGCPIVGDAKYGGPAAFLTGSISRKLHLHARSLTLAHPDGAPLSLRADAPAHMLESFATLGFEPDLIENLDPIGAAFDDEDLLAAEHGGRKPKVARAPRPGERWTEKARAHSQRARPTGRRGAGRPGPRGKR
ncbi:MAG: RluA family pseudouridine synthase [Sphingomonadales bacterium]|nr:MAG: RluA family pseudouridine synthase [Sphingomonadales bacterium]